MEEPASNAREYLQSLNYRGDAFYQDQLVVTDGNLITANATAPVDFAYHILKKLQVHSPRVLDAWYSLFKTNDPAYFFEWQQAEAPDSLQGEPAKMVSNCHDYYQKSDYKKNQ